MKKFTYHQNNSFGVWQDNMPLVLEVWAETAKDADIKAESMGVYFDGCKNEIDCPCCGDRWYRQYDEYTRQGYTE
jgi:hypothetical protein